MVAAAALGSRATAPGTPQRIAGQIGATVEQAPAIATPTRFGVVLTQVTVVVEVTMDGVSVADKHHEP